MKKFLSVAFKVLDYTVGGIAFAGIAAIGLTWGVGSFVFGVAKYAFAV